MGLKSTHHATLVRNDSVQSFDITSLVKDSFVIDKYIDKFGIDHARSLVLEAHSKPSDSDTLNLVVRTDFITLEAQNALLKVLEEPPVSTKIIFVLPSDFFVIPTLQSRFAVETASLKESESKNENFQEFIDAGYQVRLSAIEKATKNKDNDWIRSIKHGLIEHINQAEVSNDSLKSLEFVARNLLTRGASNKMLLEHAALLLGTRL